MTPRAWKRLFGRVLLWTGILLALALLFFLGENTWAVYQKSREAAAAHFDEAAELSELQTRQQSLSSELESLDTPRGVEGAIRTTYPMAKEGESVIVITDNPAQAASTSPRSPSLWDELVGWFSW